MAVQTAPNLIGRQVYAIYNAPDFWKNRVGLSQDFARRAMFVQDYSNVNRPLMLTKDNDYLLTKQFKQFAEEQMASPGGLTPELIAKYALDNYSNEKLTMSEMLKAENMGQKFVPTANSAKVELPPRVTPNQAPQQGQSFTVDPSEIPGSTPTPTGPVAVPVGAGGGIPWWALAGGGFIAGGMVGTALARPEPQRPYYY